MPTNEATRRSSRDKPYQSGGTAPGPCTEGSQPTGSRWKRLLKWGFQLSFLFFLVKGMAWLVLGWLAWKGLS